MRIYIDNADMNIVRIKAWGNQPRPANTALAEADSKYDDLFLILKRIYGRGKTTYIYERKRTRSYRRIAINVPDPLFEEYKGQYLVYYKDSGLVTWNPVKPHLELTTDAKDVLLPFNGLPDVKADGKSSCKILVQKYNSVGIPLQRGQDNDIIEFETTAGTLSSNSERMFMGKCFVTLTTDMDRFNKQVQVIAKMGSIEGSIILQFAPASLYE